MQKEIQLNKVTEVYTLSQLERAIAVSEGLSPEMGYDVLLAAAKRFVRANRGRNGEVIPVSNVIQEVSTKPFSSIDYTCHICGGYFTGSHYCTGPTSISNKSFIGAH